MSEPGFSPTEVRELLFTAAKIVAPSFRAGEGDIKLDARQKIDKLEDHLMLIARWRAKLEEAMLYMQSAVKQLEDEWDKISGWETLRDHGDKSQKSVVAAKRKVKPELYDGIREGKWLVDKLQRQIRRLERDEEYAVSRAYTMIAGS